MSQSIILIGAARSGTKFLRDMIGQSTAVATVPYDVSYVWRYGNENRPDDAFGRADAGERVRGFAPKTLRRLAGMGANDDRVLLEKTVGNTLRVEFVDEIMPQARFVHLVRDGRAVTESVVRMWEAPPDWSTLRRKLGGMPLSNAGYAFWFVRNFLGGVAKGRKGGKVWGPRYPGVDADIEAGRGLEEICARQWTESVAHARRQIAALPPERTCTVRYEDLLSDDPAPLDDFVSFLGLPDSHKVRDAFRSRADRSNINKWRDKLTVTQIETIEDIAMSELVAFGYIDGSTRRDHA